MNKGLTIKSGQTHVPAVREVVVGENRAGANRSIIHHYASIALEEAPAAYKTFRDKEDGCIKVVLKPLDQ
jgi:threonine dehydrogenase-like Zn-dependent dehydrogenase